MSNLAHSLQATRPTGRGGALPVEEELFESTPPRHIEIIATRSQKRARPKIVYALVAVAGLFVILMVQLLLSIVLSDGAYRIAALQSTQKELGRDQQTLTESLHVLGSPQNLAAQAQTLGMVVNSSDSGWLRLSDGAILKTPSAAAAASTVTTTGGGLITNTLLTPEILASETAATAAAAAAVAAGGAPVADTTTTATGTTAAGNGTTAGAPASGTADGSVASTTGAIPSPVTH
ncbi:hypothetical protein BH09ACT1_BH09ACT1_05500 [soil metagenome]